MIKQALLGEFLHEAENRRKLLQAIPDTALDYRPQPHLWSYAQNTSCERIFIQSLVSSSWRIDCSSSCYG